MAEGLKQLLLRSGQIETGAIAAIEAIDLDRHLFAFKLRREADEGNHDIGLLGAGHGFVKLCLGRRLPLEGEAAAGLIAGVGVFDAEVVRIGVGEVDRDDGLLGNCISGGAVGEAPGTAWKLPNDGKVRGLRRLPSERTLPSRMKR